MADTNELIGAGMPALQASLLGDGNATRSTYNGVGVIPASHATAGFEITSNYGGDGAVDFWSLVNENNVDTRGFNFWQKTGANTADNIGSVWGQNTHSEFDLFFGSVASSFLVSATEVSVSSIGSIPLNFYVGASGATLAGSFTAAGRFILPISVTPSAANAAGVAGTIAWDTGFLYVCVTTNTWKRVAIATW